MKIQRGDIKNMNISVEDLYLSSLVNSEAAIPYMTLHANKVKEMCEYIKNLEERISQYEIQEYCEKDLYMTEKLADAHKILQLQSELESYKQDAERYRFLRHGDNDEHCMEAYERPDWLDYSGSDSYLLRGEKLDERIDKHIQIEKEYYASLGVTYG